MSWDLFGTVPLTLERALTKEMLNVMEDMRAGEYGWAYSKALKEFRTRPDDVWGWILVESAKKQKQPLKLINDSEKLHSSSPSGSSQFLRFRSYHLAMAMEQRNQSRSQAQLSFYQRKVDELRNLMVGQRPTSLPVVIALVNSQRTPVLVARDVTLNLLKEGYGIEVAILRVRSLIRGRYGYSTYPSGDPRAKQPKVASPDPAEGPDLNGALKLLENLEAKYPKHSLILYYRAMCYAVKNLFLVKSSNEYRTNKSKAVEIASEFLRGKPKYPVLKRNMESYIRTGTVGAFSPMQDE